MRKPIVVSVIMGVTMLAGSTATLSHAQTSSQADTPTFYRLVPGTYVNGWPRFTVTYPKEWEERRPTPGAAFRAHALGPGMQPFLEVLAGSFPVDRLSEVMAHHLGPIAQEVTVVSDKPTHLRDGSPAREVGIAYVLNGAQFDWLGVATERRDAGILVDVGSGIGKIGEDLKAYLYSLELQPGLDEPVKLSSDVQAFLHSYCSAHVAHDMEKVMSHFSDRFINSGTRKAEMERVLRPFTDRITSLEIIVTDFVPAGDRAYLAGYTVGWWGKAALLQTSIIKEKGEWKWYGNQRDTPAW